MLFNSLRFLYLFLPVTMLGFHLMGRFGRRPVIVWLAFMSVVFYAAWNPVFVLFLLGSIAVNYLVSQAIAGASENSALRNRLLFFGIALNLLALFYFKYLFKALLLLKDLHLTHLDPHPILLPLGISFFTFTQISYLVDLAQGQAERQDLLSYLLFVTFFPHLIAGPILHHKEMMPQFAESSTSPMAPARINPAASPSIQTTSPSASPGSSWASPKKSSSPTSSPPPPTSPSNTPAPSPPHPPGPDSSSTPCRSTSTSPATPTWRSASPASSPSASPSTSTPPTRPPASPSTGSAGT